MLFVSQCQKIRALAKLVAWPDGSPQSNVGMINMPCASKGNNVASWLFKWLANSELLSETGDLDCGKNA